MYQQYTYIYIYYIPAADRSGWLAGYYRIILYLYYLVFLRSFSTVEIYTRFVVIVFITLHTFRRFLSHFELRIFYYICANTPRFF